MRKKFALGLLTGVMALMIAAANTAWADETGNQVFFRGGWTGMTSDRGSEVFTDTNGALRRNDGSSGYHIGAGLDLVLSKDVWGMMSQTWALGEVGVEFKRLGSNQVCQTTTFLTTGACNPTHKVQITMLTVDVAPKIKFMEGSRLRPWVIPIGLDFHVISPPSNDVTVLDIGVQWGVGLEYRLYKAFHVGLDGRFHLTANQTDTTNNFGTVGAYVGISF
jgi:hypothetical protein